MVVALLVILFLTVALASVLMSPSIMFEDKINSVVLILFTLSATVMMLSCIVSQMDKDRLVIQVVGVLPSQIDEWKWKMLAQVKVVAHLSLLARKIKDLDKEEREMLGNALAPPEKVLEMHRLVKEALHDFREVHDVFQKKCGIELKEAWKDYVS